MSSKNPSPEPAETSRSETTGSDAGTQQDAETERKPHTIVGVGASAGGLEAFSQLLGGLPQDTDLCLLLVQHLAPRQTSALPELLAGSSRLPVISATDGMEIEPGWVYVMPPDVHMDIMDGRIHLVPRPTNRTQHNPIDFLFRSLAAYAQERAIGVILSGTGSDGAQGLREIKALGGIAIAQSPETAKYEGMPRVAIATGVVDLVLSAQEIAEELLRIRRHPYLRHVVPRRPGDELPLNQGHLQQILALLRKATGVDFSQYKSPTLQRRLQRRMALHKISSVDHYVRFLKKSPSEVSNLYQDILIHVTRFFREPESFQALREVVFRRIVEGRSEEDPIRIWIPGCSTGEEPYSVAIELLDFLGERATETALQIFATDISESTIEHARAGLYPESIAADVPADRLKHYFTRSEGGYRISQAVRDLCIFARQDLTRDPPFSRLDLIVCRNVLIYLGPAVQKRLLNVFHYALKPSAFLMLGMAETVGPSGDLFSIIDKKNRIYARRAIEAPSVGTFSTDYTPRRPRFLPRPAPDPQAVNTVHNQATRLLLDRFAPPSVVVDGDLTILQTRGHTGPYLELAPGEPSLNILKMAREGLLHALREAIEEARRDDAPSRKEGVRVTANGGIKEVTVEVIPIATAQGSHFLIIFQQVRSDQAAAGEDGSPTGGAVVSQPGTPDEKDRLIRHLEKELAASRDYLQSIIQDLEAANEELQSANEEILSANEELQSTNEELDTAKEELQSTNEELNTVNEELHSRNEELSRANSDLMNLLASLQIAIVMVSNDLRIRRFTSMAEQVLNLIPSDLGRPIGQIKPNLDVPDLETLITRSIDSMTQVDREVRGPQGQTYLMRIRPYKDLENRIDGAILTLLTLDTGGRGSGTES